MPRPMNCLRNLLRHDAGSRAFNEQLTSYTGKKKAVFGQRVKGRVMPKPAAIVLEHKYRKWLGPKGPLGYDTIFYIKLKPWAELRARKNIIGTRGLMQFLSGGAGLTQQDLTLFLREYQMHIISYVEKFLIGMPAAPNTGLAPMETGTLRRAMINAVRNAATQDGAALRGWVLNTSFERGFHTKLGTPGIDYARPVNEMTPTLGFHTRHNFKVVQRPYYSYGAPKHNITLRDTHAAEQQYYNRILMEARRYAEEYYVRWLRIHNLSYQKMKQVFEIKFNNAGLKEETAP
jgi:hypothetical protein